MNRQEGYEKNYEDLQKKVTSIDLEHAASVLDLRYNHHSGTVEIPFLGKQYLIKTDGIVEKGKISASVSSPYGSILISYLMNMP